MKRNYWENMAGTYNEEIFDVLQQDKKALVRSAIEQFASRSKTVGDFGCAVGKWLPLLSPLFKKVYAIDISAKNLAIAKAAYPHLANVEYIRADLSGKKRIPVCDAGICINAILTPSPKDRDQFFTALKNSIKRNGTLIITVPSLESWMLTRVIQQQWKIDSAYFSVTRNAEEALRKWKNICRGNVEIDDVPHKHFLEEELEIVLSRNGFATEAIQKIEYNWNTEFHQPPRWLKKPGPWDWMVLARKL